MPEQPMLTARGTVYPWQCDHMGHMNVMYYVAKFDEATWHLFAHIGLTPTFLREQQRGMAAVHQEIEYLHEMLAGNIYSITTQVIEVRDKVLRFAHEMRNDETNAVVATTLLTAVHLDTQSRRACPLPVDVAGRARAMLAAGDLTAG